jgi:hypothetical protein
MGPNRTAQAGRTRRLIFRSVRWVTEFGAGGGADFRLSNIHYENFMPAQTAIKSVQIRCSNSCRGAAERCISWRFRAENRNLGRTFGTRTPRVIRFDLMRLHH